MALVANALWSQPRVAVIAHRGEHLRHPENSVTAVKQAFDLDSIPARAASHINGSGGNQSVETAFVVHRNRFVPRAPGAFDTGDSGPLSATIH